jgi:hypothetical protein
VVCPLTLATLCPDGALAEWLRSGLQSRLHRFDSGRRLSQSDGSGNSIESRTLNGAAITPEGDDLDQFE